MQGNAVTCYVEDINLYTFNYLYTYYHNITNILHTYMVREILMLETKDNTLPQQYYLHYIINI